MSIRLLKWTLLAPFLTLLLLGQTLKHQSEKLLKTLDLTRGRLSG